MPLNRETLDSQDEDLLALVDRLDLASKIALLTGQDSWSLRPIFQIGLRSVVMSDGPAGVRGKSWDERDPSFSFPCPTSMAASWDRERVRAIGEGLGHEARRKEADVILGPTINLLRTPYGGRGFEAFSEDPVLTADLATAYVEGVQSTGVGATVKHYVANDSETDRFNVDVLVDERTLREVYLLAFEDPIVRGGAWLVMSAYNSINGTTSSENLLLTTPLTDEWGFDGVVVSDWTAVRSIESARHPQDLVMPGPHGPWGEHLVEAVESGTIDESTIDAKVVRVLRLAARVGALKGHDTRPSLNSDLNLRMLARESSADGMVLLSNDGILPMDEPRSIAVLGEAAVMSRIQGGGSATVVPDKVVSPLEGLRQTWPGARIEWARGAVVQQGVAGFGLGTYTTPDGEPGVLVRYLDSSGGELASETRQASSLVWFNGDSMASAADGIEFLFRLVPEPPVDEVMLGLAGVADYEVAVDGEMVTRGELRTGPEDDPSSVVLNPPSTSVRVPFSSESAQIGVRFTPKFGGMPDALALKVGLAPPETDAGELISEAVELAVSSDVAIVVVGTSSEIESEGFDRDSLQLPGHQDELVRAVSAANPRTIVVVNSGAPVMLPWRDEAAAVLAAWFPGQEFGHALGDVLSGHAEPGGRLPMTWPAEESEIPVSEVTPVNGQLAYDEGIHVGYRAWMRTGRRPAFPFGHGLGYTEWELTDLKVTSPESVGPSEVSVKVSNAGTRAGKCVVQFYLERVSPSSVDRPVRWLADFEAIRLGPADTKTLRTTIPWRRLAHWEDDSWHVEPGDFRLVASLTSEETRLTAPITIPGDWSQTASAKLSETNAPADAQVADGTV